MPCGHDFIFIRLATLGVMEVILLEPLQGIGQKGDLKRVRPGFYRNYLLPQGKAVLATDSVKKAWDKRREKMVLAKETLKTKAKEFLERITGKVFVIKQKATKKGTLYSAVTPEKVVEILKVEAKVELSPEMVILKVPIKKTGVHEIKIRVEEGAETNMSLDIQHAQ